MIERGISEILEDLVQESERFSSKEGFWRWMAEKIMRQDWKKLCPYGLSYVFNIWRMFSEDEKRKFKKQYESGRKEWLVNNHIPRSAR